MNKNRMHRALALAMSGALTLGSAMPALAASKDLPAAGEIGYVSAHEYVTKTDMDGIYKVTLSIKGVGPDPIETRVVTVVDNSQSMNYNDKMQLVDSQSNWSNAWDFSNSVALPGLWDQLEAVITTSVGPDSDMDEILLRSPIAAYAYGYNSLTGTAAEAVPPSGTMFTAYDFTVPQDEYESYDDARIVFPRGKIVDNYVPTSGINPVGPAAGPHYTSTYSLSARQTAMALPSGPDASTNFGKRAATIGDNVVPGTWDAQLGWPAVTQDAPGATNDLISDWMTPADAKTMTGYTTRLGAALEGAKAATEAFLTKENNPAYNKTSFGLVAFASGTDAIQEEPYATAGAGDYGFGTGITNEENITFSTRLGNDGVGSSPINAYYTLVGAGDPIGIGGEDYFNRYEYIVGPAADGTLYNHLEDVAANTATYDAHLDNDVSGTLAEELAEFGLVPYDPSGKGKTALKYALDKAIVNSTSNAGSNIISGIEEAEQILYGPEGGAAGTGYTLNDAGQLIGSDGIRRFVILLSDGMDTNATPEATISKANELKEDGVEFLVIGIDTPDGANAESEKTQTSGATAPGRGAGSQPGNGAFGDYMAYMASRLQTYQTGYGSWGAVELDYWNNGQVIDPLYPQNYMPKSAANNYTYIPRDGSMIENIEAAFEKYVNRIIYFGENAKMDLKLNTNAYELYHMQGKPLFEFTGDPKQYMETTGDSWVWHQTGLPLYGINTVTFYVKMDADTDGTMSHAIFSDSEYSIDGPFPVRGQVMPPYGWQDRSITVDVPDAHITGQGQIKQESTEDDVKGVNDGYGQDSLTGAQQHQQNREDAKSTADYMGTMLDVTPEITEVKTGTAASGKAKAIVAVKNNAHMRFQWQMKNESGEWEDIFGATSSQYTLGNSFKTGQEYELRCKISNGIGKVFYSDSVKITQSAGAKSSGLQTKSGK